MGGRIRTYGRYISYPAVVFAFIALCQQTMPTQTGFFFGTMATGRLRIGSPLLRVVDGS